MKIALSNIVENPHRNLVRNPISIEQVNKIAESIGRTGFWDNVVVRKHPTQRGKYELAYGHNRMAALGHPTIKAKGDKRKLLQKDAQFIVRDLNDYDMLTAMADENATQQKITPKITFENVTAAIVLAEKLLSECANVTEFNKRAKNSMRLAADASGKSPWSGLATPSTYWQTAPDRHGSGCTGAVPCPGASAHRVPGRHRRWRCRRPGYRQPAVRSDSLPTCPGPRFPMSSSSC